MLRPAEDLVLYVSFTLPCYLFVTDYALLSAELFDQDFGKVPWTKVPSMLVQHEMTIVNWFDGIPPPTEGNYSSFNVKKLRMIMLKFRKDMEGLISEDEKLRAVPWSKGNHAVL